MPGKHKSSTHQPKTVETSTEHVIHSGHSQLRIRVRTAQDANIHLLLESFPEASQPATQVAPAAVRQPEITSSQPIVPDFVPTQLIEAVPAPLQAIWLKTLGDRLKPLWNLEVILLVLAVAIYLITRLVGLEKFPIYSFNGEFLPYPVFATRAASVLVTLLAAICVGLTLKNVFKFPNAWVATLLLSITPAWFLHSRTAFETALATSFFAGFIYFYLMYRTSSPRSLYGAVLMGALTFYSYSPARAVIGVAALLLLFSDLGYHWRNRKTVLLALGMTILMAVPFIRTLIIYPEENIDHLRVLNSYWIQDISLFEKLGRFGLEYLKGLNPLYWFSNNSMDIPLNKMEGYGHVLAVTFPFLLLGLGLAFRHIKQSPYRTLLLCMLAAPAGAALVEVSIARSLSTVVPLVLLTGLGMVWLLQWLEKRFNVPRLFMVLPLFALMAAANLYMLRDALTNDTEPAYIHIWEVTQR
jgi:hypothetical protein